MTNPMNTIVERMVNNTVDTLVGEGMVAELIAHYNGPMEQEAFDDLLSDISSEIEVSIEAVIKQIIENKLG